jgi:hypothetical protein
MPNLEYVIRPYQSPSPFGTTLIASTPSSGTDRATLTWGATAQGTPPAATEATASNPQNMTYKFECCNEKLQETSRSTDTKRIMGNDGESYVDVERPYQMTLKRNTKTVCDGPLDQISWVNQGINAVLNDFEADISEATDKFGSTDSNCGSQWNFPQ